MGADMVVGSDQEPGRWTCTPIGGYIAGRKDLIDNLMDTALTSPGLGKEVGASLGVMQSFLQGLLWHRL